ncbi:MAG: hypothetical protein IJG87_01985 [Ruminococcus sp.]|nr:hypothetical protein [Ruminococcus sp.]
MEDALEDAAEPEDCCTSGCSSCAGGSAS